MSRKARAVVCREHNKPVVVEELTVDSPKRGEVMVKLGACGVCHSDLSAITGTIPLPLPLVLGHEGAGVVEEVGEGVSDFAECDFTNTAATANYLLPPVPPREIKPGERGKVVYLGICTGCHTYNGRMIGPPVQVIQALYMDNPQGLADFIAKPTKKRDDYPEMPPQDYLDPETRLAVAQYMLQVTN